MADQFQQINLLLDHVFAFGPLWVYGLLVVVCFIENVFPPFPGDTFIVAAGLLVATGRLDLVPACLCITSGGLASVMLMYFLGRRYGRGYFVRKNFKYFTVDDIDRVEKGLRRRGALILIFSRFAVGIRSVLAAVAGIGRYPAGLMLLYSAISYVIFVGLIMIGSMKLVENFDRLEYYFRAYERIAWLLIVLAVLVLVARKVRAVRRSRQL